MIKFEIEPEYEIGDILYLKTDIQKLPRLVHHYIVYIANGKQDVLYYMVCGESGAQCTSLELTKDRGFINTIGFSSNR